MKILLKRCPFCGAKAEVFIPASDSSIPHTFRQSNRVGLFLVRCSCPSCCIRTRFYRKLKLATDSWNRRDRFQNANRYEDTFVKDWE